MKTIACEELYAATSPDLYRFYAINHFVTRCELSVNEPHVLLVAWIGKFLPKSSGSGLA